VDNAGHAAETAHTEPYRACQPTRPLLIGLVGGIGSGKSEVARLLAERGAWVIEADRLGHEALEQPDIRRQVLERWGSQVADAQGKVDRRRLAAIVFARESERRALEQLVFPWIAQGIEREWQRAQRHPQVRVVVLDAAILLETGWGQRCDGVIFVDAPPHMRQKRAMAQRQWSAQEWAAREAAQWPVERKRAYARWVIDNSGSLEDLRLQVDRIWKQLTQEKPSESSPGLGPATAVGA